MCADLTTVLSAVRRLAHASLTTRLFLAWLFIGLLVAFAMGVAVRASFEQGFQGYVDARDTERTEAWSRALEGAYREHGSWDFLVSDRAAWWRLMMTTLRATGTQSSLGLRGELPPPTLGVWAPPGFLNDERPGSGPADADRLPDPLVNPPPISPGSPPATDVPTAHAVHDRPAPGPASGPRSPGPDGRHRPPPVPPMALLDAHRQVVAGRLPRGEEADWHALHNQGEVIGWLVTARPGLGPLSAIDRRFQDAQTRAVMLIGLLAAAAAGGLGWAVARGLLAPVRRLAQATHRLAQGDYSVQVEHHSDDEIGRLASAFNRMAQALGQHERSRRALLADVSHELRTPLAVLRGEIEALQDGIRSATPSALESLLGEVDALSRLVDDVHDLAAADTGGWSYLMAPLDLGPLLDTTSTVFVERCAAKGLTLIPPDTWPNLPMLGDARRLTQLWRNLLENAVRYTDPGGRVELNVWQESGYIVLRVQDSAPGVRDDQLPRLFERFYRVEESRSRAHGGSGLGLALCRQIVVAHHGRITAEHSPLGGVCFTVVLPHTLPAHTVQPISDRQEAV